MKLIWAVSQNAAARQVSKLVKCALYLLKKVFTVVVSEFAVKIIVQNYIYILKVQRHLYQFEWHILTFCLFLATANKFVYLGF